MTLAIVDRLRQTWRDAAASAVAAVLAWVAAQYLFGHPQPIFAAVSAVVCLSPGLPSHGRQAVGLLLGVAIGIGVGELALFLPDGIPLLRLGLAAFFAIAIAAVFGFPAVVPIQSGVSAILVLALGPEAAGPARMLDVAAGTVIGLFFSQVLLTPDPLQMIDAAAGKLFRELASGFRKSAEALNRKSQKKAEDVLQILSEAHDNVVDLTSGIAAARSAARWSVRGRIVAQQVGQIAARYDRQAIRLYASTLLFAEAMGTALGEDGGIPQGLQDRMLAIAARCDLLASGDGGLAGASHLLNAPATDRNDGLSATWNICMENLRLVELAVDDFQVGARPRLDTP